MEVSFFTYYSKSMIKHHNRISAIAFICAVFLMPLALRAQPYVEFNSNLIHPTATDPSGNVWDGGYYTQEGTVKVSFNALDPSVETIRIGTLRGTGFIRGPKGFTHIILIVDQNQEWFDVKSLAPGETFSYDISTPGLYCLRYCAVDADGNILEAKTIDFDSLYDDGNWTTVGTATLSSGILNGILEDTDKYEHLFVSNGNGWLEQPGDDVWYWCPVNYPYYKGETWEAKLEYNQYLDAFRIVNPFTVNPQFQDYFPEDSELLGNFWDNVAITPEALIFDRENPAWLLIHTEYPHDAYCEATRTGILACHEKAPFKYVAHRYNEIEGWVVYDVCPAQDIENTSTFIDMPLDNPLKANIIVNFPDLSNVDRIIETDSEMPRFFNLQGIEVKNPSGDIYIKKTGNRTQKVFIP